MSVGGKGRDRNFRRGEKLVSKEAKCGVMVRCKSERRK